MNASLQNYLFSTPPSFMRKQESSCFSSSVKRPGFRVKPGMTTEMVVLQQFLSIVFLFFLLVSPLLAQQKNSLTVSAQIQVLPSTTTVLAQESRLSFNFLSNQRIEYSSRTVPSQNDFLILQAVSSKPKQDSSGKWHSKLSIRFLPINLGELEFPSLQLHFLSEMNSVTTVQVPPIKLRILSSISGVVSPQMLRDIHGPWEVGIPNSTLLLIGISLILFLAAIFYLVRSNKRKEEMPLVPLRPPEVLAREKLALLLDQYQKSPNIKLFYSDLSNIFREYLSRFYSMEAMENTTSEIFTLMRKREIDKKFCIGTKEILSNCDLVKFAKWIPSEPELHQDFEKVQDLVETSCRSVIRESIEVLPK